jgi:3-dehydroquinate dehydratase/shikimate dehydrogenase
MPNQPTNICAVITEETVAAARQAIHRAASEADMIEVRLDYLHDFDFANPESLRYLLKDNSLPVIITCRAFEEGGQQLVDNSIRLPLLIEGAKQFADYCDIEASHYFAAAKLVPDPAKLIVSYHNFDETPINLEEIYERIARIPAKVHKFATRANTVVDTLATFHLLKRAASEGRTLIALAMNEPGVVSRLLGPSQGSFLTYGALTDGRGSAPGQFTCDELRKVYRLDHLTRKTPVTGLIGKPVSHSASPAMHNAAFASLSMDGVYLPLEVDEIEEFFEEFIRPASRRMEWNLLGLSVTIPHKVSVIPLLDELDESAVKIGAVNTIVISGERLKGYNTDAQGALEPLLRICSLEGKRCAVVGAGGAARAVTYGVKKGGAGVTIFARDLARSGKLADEFQVELRPAEAISDCEFDILINTTPVGMRHHSQGQSVVPEAALPNFKIVYDLVYTPLETRLLREAKAAGCTTIGGLDMLVAQAALQFELWTGRKPSPGLMRAAAMAKLSFQLDES